MCFPILFSPKTVRASAGSVFSVPVSTSTDAASAVAHLRGLGHSLVATDSTGSEDLYEADLEGPCTVVLGNEASGLDVASLGMCDRTLRIPMAGGESLNVASASAVVLFEIVRRRRAQ